MSLCVSVCVCGVPNVRLLSLVCMPNHLESVKCKNGICICECMCLCTFIFLCVCGVCAYNHACISVYLYLCVNVSVHVFACLSVCACAILWYAKYLWHVCQMSQKVQNVKMVSVSVCVHESVCICMCLWCAKCEITIFGMYAKSSKKCEM